MTTSESASTARTRLVEEGVVVLDAPPGSTAQPHLEERHTVMQYRDTTPATQNDTSSGPEPGSNEPASSSPTSRSSAEPSPGSTPRSMATPKNVREFASQVNQIASAVLNGEIDLERARVYSGLARTVAQAMSTEVSRARFLAQVPDLTFEEETDV